MKLNRSLSDLFEHDDDDVIYDPDTFYQEYDYQRPVEYVDIIGSAGPSSQGGLGRRGSMNDSVFIGAATRRGSMTDSFFTTGGASLSKRSSTMNGSSRRSSLTNSFADSSFYWNESIRGAPNVTNLHSSSPDDLLLDDQSVSEHHDFDSELNNSLQKIGNSSLSSNTIKLCELSNDSKSSFLSPEYKKMRNTQSRKGNYLPGSLEMGGSLHTPSSSRQFYQQQQQQHQQPFMKQRRRNSTNSQTIAGSSSIIQDHRREIEKILLQAGKVAEQVANSTNTPNSNNSKSSLSRISSGNTTSCNRNTSINTQTSNTNTKSTIPSNTIPSSGTKRPEVRRSRSSNTQTKSPILKLKYQAVDEDTDTSTISTTMTSQQMESKVIISLHAMKQFHQNNNKKNQPISNPYHYHHNHHHPPQQRHAVNPTNPASNSRKPRQLNEQYDSPVISSSGSNPALPSPIATTISSRHSNISNQRPDLAPKLPSRCRSPVRSSTVTIPT